LRGLKEIFQNSMPFYLLTNYAKTRTNLSRHLWWACLVYIGENKPGYVVWKTKKRQSIPA